MKKTTLTALFSGPKVYVYHNLPCTGVQDRSGFWQRWLDDMLASVLITINIGDNR